MNTEIELQLHEAYIDGNNVCVLYSLVSDIAVTEIAKKFTVKNLINFLEDRRWNEWEEDGYIRKMHAETYLADNLYALVKSYIMEDNR